MIIDKGPKRGLEYWRVAKPITTSFISVEKQVNTTISVPLQLIILLFRFLNLKDTICDG